MAAFHHAKKYSRRIIVEKFITGFDFRQFNSPPLGNVPCRGPSGVPGRPRAIYVGHDGQVHAVEVSPGESLMRASLRNNLPGIIAECGGACMYD